MIFFHMSHTDLDGYGCQFVSKQVFKDGYFYNANYGIEIKLNLQEILKQISKLDKTEKIFFLITDLNLTFEESKQLDQDIKKFNQQGFDIELLLLDHHGSGKKSANYFHWYFLDTSRSATKITFDYFYNKYDIFKKQVDQDQEYIKLINAINAVDIWLENDELFEFGKVCLSMVDKASEINSLLFCNRSRDFKHFLLQKAKKFINQPNSHIELDQNVYFLKKEFLNINKKNDTIDNLSSYYLIDSLEDKKEQFTIYYKDKKGLLTYTLHNISIPANAFLKANNDYDFFMNLSKHGRAGFRSNNKLDVSILANKLAKGGGHPNASGASFDDFKETIIYDEVKSYIQNKLDNCD